MPYHSLADDSRSRDSEADSTGNDDFALAAHSTPLTSVISQEMASAGGRITFERFMSLALGHPDWGYYSQERLLWGAAGDYETSPEVHPIFGYLWAKQVAECWKMMGKPNPFSLVEVGAGSGAFSVAILCWLREREPACANAVQTQLVDGHPNRLKDQQRALESMGLSGSYELLEDWLSESQPIRGLVISNEFFDSLPVHLVERRGEKLHEWNVVSQPSGGLGLRLGPPGITPALESHFKRIGVTPGDGCRAEASLAASDLMSRISQRIEHGYMITIDYGGEAAAIYAPWRRMGTLMAYRNHSPQPDPLASPGLLDLTAHVDFTTLISAASSFSSAPTVSQGEALVALGIGEALKTANERGSRNFAQYASDRRAAETLCDPAGLGRIRVLVQARTAPLEGLLCLKPVLN